MTDSRKTGKISTTRIGAGVGALDGMVYAVGGHEIMSTII